MRATFWGENLLWHTPVPVRCTDPERRSVFGHADGEWKMQDARRRLAGRATGRGHVEARSAVDRDDRATAADDSRDARAEPADAGVGAGLGPNWSVPLRTFSAMALDGEERRAPLDSTIMKRRVFRASPIGCHDNYAQLLDIG